MSVLNPPSSDDEPSECPLCMEYLELDDFSFYPCSCGYQICRFCWNKIRTEGSGNCPACRSPYAENPADFKPLTAEELARIKAEKRQRDHAKKQKISENRKHLANVRVVQRNLVFVVGLSPRLSDQDVLRKPEYFGKFGKIHKVVINQNTAYAGSQTQGPSASAYVTYYRPEDALKAIQAVNNIFIDGRTLKASLGTTKYCSHFMKNQACPKHDCMYLHELGDEAASFTKEQMQQGKHTDYEKELHDEMIKANSANSSAAVATASVATAAAATAATGKASPSTAVGAKAAVAAAVAVPASVDGSDQSVVSLKNSRNQQQQSNHTEARSSRTPSPREAELVEDQARSDHLRWQSATTAAAGAAGAAGAPTSNTAKDDEGNSDRNGGGGGHQYLEQQQQLLLGLQTGGSKGNNNRRQQTNKERKAPVEQQSHRNQEPWPTSSSSPSPNLNNGIQIPQQAITQQQPQQQPQQQQFHHPKQSLNFAPKSNSSGPPPGLEEDDDDDDGLGFDPFAEGQKLIAEDMLESDTRLLLQQQQQQQQHNFIQQQQFLRNGVNSTPSPQPPSGSSGQQQPQQQQRLKAPPPGFGGHQQHQQQQPPPQQRFSNSSPFDTFASQIVAQQMQQQNSLTDHFPHHPGLQHKLRSSPQQQQHQSSSDWQEGFRALLPNVNVSFGNLPGGLGGGASDHQHHHFPQQQQQQQQQQHPLHSHPVLPGFASQHHQRQSTDQDRVAAAAAAAMIRNNTGWGSSSIGGNSGGGGSDLGLFGDPAIVGGSLTNLGGAQQQQHLHHHHAHPPPGPPPHLGPPHHIPPPTAATGARHPHLRSESPPSWIKANLEQLTADTGPKLLPGFGNLNLGLGASSAASGSGTRWGGSAGAPPPGFARNNGFRSGDN